MQLSTLIFHSKYLFLGFSCLDATRFCEYTGSSHPRTFSRESSSYDWQTVTGSGFNKKNPYVNEQEKKGRSNGLSKRYSLVTKHAKTKANHACRKVLNTTTSGFWQRKIPTVFTLFRNNKLTLTTIALAFVWRAMSLLFKSFFYPKPAALKFRLVNSSRPPTACFWTTW